MKTKVILACSVGGLGSAAFSMAYADYLRAKKSNFEIAGVVGSSGGAIAAAVIARGILGKTVVNYMSKTFSEKWLVDNDLSQQFIDKILRPIYKRKGDAPLSGLIRGNAIRKAYSMITKEFGLDKPIIPCGITATQIHCASPLAGLLAGPIASMQETLLPLVVFRENQFTPETLPQYMRASSAIPIVLRPEHIDDGVYVDGGCCSLTAIDVGCKLGKEIGADLVIGLNYQHMTTMPKDAPDDIITVAEATLKAAGLGLHNYCVSIANHLTEDGKMSYYFINDRPKDVFQKTFDPKTLLTSYGKYYEFFEQNNL